MMDRTHSISSRLESCALLATAVFPTLAAWLYFVALKEQPTALQQTAYVGCKIIQFGFPLLWVVAIQRQRLQWQRPKTAGLIDGIVFGALIFIGTWVLYVAWWRPAGYLNIAVEPIIQKLKLFGVSSPAGFVVCAVFFSALHSLMEEYYWRWFLFGGLRRLMPLWPAVLLSGFAFAGHHVITLAAYFGWCSWAPWFFSLCVAVGGMVWAWIYQRSNSLLGPWLSHLLIDAAIFVVGYDLVRNALGW
jgi:uncharacterized protein